MNRRLLEIRARKMEIRKAQEGAAHGRGAGGEYGSGRIGDGARLHRAGADLEQIHHRCHAGSSRRRAAEAGGRTERAERHDGTG